MDSLLAPDTNQNNTDDESYAKKRLKTKTDEQSPLDSLKNSSEQENNDFKIQKSNPHRHLTTSNDKIHHHSIGKPNTSEEHNFNSPFSRYESNNQDVEKWKQTFSKIMARSYKNTANNQINLKK